VLTTRLAHILALGRARPWELLVVTFTNKAAREMRERIGALIGPEAEGLRWLGTFHSVAAQILRRHAELVGLKSSFTILDTDDQERLLKQILEAEKIDQKRWPPKMLGGLIDHWKNRGWTPDKLPATENSAFAGNKGQAMYRLYQERLRVLNACDFGDLLLHNLTIFTTAPDVLTDFHNRFRYILVDEYQDTNVAQYLWLRLLAQGRQNVCCVVDLWLARGGGGQHPALRAGFSGRPGDPAGTQLPLHGPYPGRRLGPDQGQQGAPGQDPVDRGDRRRKGAGARRLGRRG
jgi:DNA helicase-2/ATP-dependent DNA helicase PcrA